MRVSCGYKNSKGVLLHDVTIFDKKFKGVKNLKKYKNCSQKNCKYYSDCRWNDGVVRFFDCKKNAHIANRIYNLITTAIVFSLMIIIFFVCHFSIVRSIAILIISLVVLDILCTIGEDSIDKIRERHFYNKLERIEKRKNKLADAEQKQKESQKAVEEMEKATKNANYKSVIEAESFVKKLKKISDDYDFGPNEEKIDICVNKLFDIISVLKEDSSGYSRVAFLFEAYLPEFYNTLKFYSDFIKADVVKDEQVEILTKCVDKFLNFLDEQKVEAILDKKSIEIQFKATAETLGKMIDKGENV